jgi:molybdate transport system regulatory protein
MHGVKIFLWALSCRQGIFLRDECDRPLRWDSRPAMGDTMVMGKEKLRKMTERKSTNSRILVAGVEDRQCLDSEQLNRLEQSFRAWADAASRLDVHLSRKRMLILFLLIRYTGAKLNEVLALDPFRDIDIVKQSVFFRGSENAREVQISESLAREFGSIISDQDFRESIKDGLSVDPAFVRRKFYERAKACGFSGQLVGPEMVRRSRAVELVQSNLPLQVVQKLLGHSTPNLTAAYVGFSEDESREVTKHFMEREAARKTSARNYFFGKIVSLARGDIQTLVELSTSEGHRVVTMITNDSLGRLGLQVGKRISAEVKAPWVFLQKGEETPQSTAENKFLGCIERVIKGKINTEYVVRISDGIELCSIVTTRSGNHLGLEKGDAVWALFSCFSVILHVD